MSGHRRDSDRWITPRVVAWALFLATVLILSVVASITYLTARGLDPSPMVEVVAKVATAVGSLGTLVLQLVSRSTTAKVERNTGLLADKVDGVDAKVDAALWVEDDPAEATRSLPPVPPRLTQPHPFGT